MREAVALLPRLELRIPGQEGPIVAGFRRDGCLSLYFAGDPLYQFDAQGRLRRAFVGGKLFRSQGDVLAELTRVRTDCQTVLARRDLNREEFAQFVDEMLTRLSHLAAALAQQPPPLLRQIPSDESIIPRLQQALEQIMDHAGKLSPPINKRR